MNNVTLSGRICCVPRIRILQIDGHTINICNFTLANMDGMDEKDIHTNQNTAFFECVCFGREAMAINSNFQKGSKIIVQGKLKNHFYEDANRTKHFTNLVLLTQVEYGDTASPLERGQERNKAVDLSITSNVTDILSLYEEVCENGYLCIDEDEYYRIAMDNYF